MIRDSAPILTALVRSPSPLLVQCELTHLERASISYELVLSQHSAYCETLKSLGAKVLYLPELPDSPDGVFVEDIALVLDELAVITRPGAATRLSETKSAEPALKQCRTEVFHLEAPATLDGGDVLRIGKKLFTGLSSRTNQGGQRQLAAIAQPFGYEVISVEVRGCLHLKTAVTWLGGELLVANPKWIDLSPFKGFEVLPVDPLEPFAGNTLTIGDTVVCAAQHARTATKIASRGHQIRFTEISELAKAEAGLTCLSILGMKH